MKLRRAESTIVWPRGDRSSGTCGGEQSGPREMTKGGMAMASLANFTCALFRDVTPVERGTGSIGQRSKMKLRHHVASDDCR